MSGLILEQVINGIIAGSIYALVAAGMTMIFGVLRAINFAHGEYYMLGTFSAWFLIDKLNLPYVATIVLGVIVTMALAAVIGRVVMQRLVTAPFQSGVLATLGLSLILQNAVILTFGGTYKVFAGGWLDPVVLGDISIAQQRIVVVAATIVVFAVLEFVVRRTRMGKCIRAVSQNTECCQVNGIDVERVVLGTFVLGTGLAALSGVLTGPINVTLYGGMGEAITLKTFAVIVMGGMGNVRGTLFAGWILGIAETFVAGYVGLQFRDAVGFAILIAMLMFRPTGFFSAQARF
jgi:branched-chain amino acid transport system permease protein